MKPLIDTCVGFWTRGYVENHPKTLFIFTDNTDRTSGYGPIDEDSWYYKKYGNGRTLCYPNSTSACIRGLRNAFPISLQKHYNYQNSSLGNWDNSEYEEFDDIIADEVNDIAEAFSTGEYDGIMYPRGGLFDGSIANITYERVPILRMIAESTIKAMEMEILEDTKQKLIKEIIKDKNSIAGLLKWYRAQMLPILITSYK